MKREKEISIEDLRVYITSGDIKVIAKKSGVSQESIRKILRGDAKRSKAMSLCFEVARQRKEAMSRVARDIVEVGAVSE